MEIVAAPHLHPDDFASIMKTEVVDPFYEKLKVRRGDWGDLQKIPVRCVGAQV